MHILAWAGRKDVREAEVLDLIFFRSKFLCFLSKDIDKCQAKKAKEAKKANILIKWRIFFAFKAKTDRCQAKKANKTKKTTFFIHFFWNYIKKIIFVHIITFFRFYWFIIFIFEINLTPNNGQNGKIRLRNLCLNLCLTLSNQQIKQRKNPIRKYLLKTQRTSTSVKINGDSSG